MRVTNVVAVQLPDERDKRERRGNEGLRREVVNCCWGWCEIDDWFRCRGLRWTWCLVLGWEG